MTAFPDPDVLATALAEHGYLADPALTTAVYLADALNRPLFLEGAAGVGKTSLAAAVARARGTDLIRLQCYEGIDAAQALYDWNFPRQLLHLRAAQWADPDGADPAAGSATAPDDAGRGRPTRRAADALYTEEFLLERPILAALRRPGSVLLIDEIDRADDEFEAFLLEVLGEFTVTIPELGTVRADVPPLVFLTSNRTREVHDALKRRCLYHWVEHPTPAREVAILRARLPGVSEELARQVAGAVARMRSADLVKPPGVAESLDWARALQVLGCSALDLDAAARTLGVVVKYQEDVVVVAADLERLIAS